MLGHSPGEAAFPNVGLFLDSHAQKGILRVTGGEGGAPLRGGGGKKRLTFPGVKAASDVELQPIFFYSKKTGGKPDLWTP